MTKHWWWCGLAVLLVWMSRAASQDLLLDVQDVDDPYKNLVVRMDPGVKNCNILVSNMRKILESASQLLYNATQGRLAFTKFTVLVPESLSQDCGTPEETPTISKWPKVHVAAGKEHPLFGGEPWVQQTQGCGKPGDLFYLSQSFLRQDMSSSSFLMRGRRVVHEWAKLRWGVFEELGIAGDEVFPLAYTKTATLPDNVDGWLPNYCSDVKLLGTFNESCQLPDCPFYLAEEQEATSSLLALPTVASVTNFCDSETHLPLTPTKHNAQCGGMSVMEIYARHQDSWRYPVDNDGATLRMAMAKYDINSLAKYVILMEATQVMSNTQMSERWNMLKKAVMHWVLEDIRDASMLGVATFGSSYHLQNPMTTISNTTRQKIAESVSSTLPGSSYSKCITPALQSVSQSMLDKGGNIILIVSPESITTSDSLEAMVNAANGNAVWPILFPFMVENSASSVTLFKDLADNTRGRVLMVEDMTNGIQQSVKVQRNLIQQLRTIQDTALRYTSYIPTLQMNQGQLNKNSRTFNLSLNSFANTQSAALFIYSSTNPSYVEVNEYEENTQMVTNTSFKVPLSRDQNGSYSINIVFPQTLEPHQLEVMVKPLKDDLKVELWSSHDLSTLNLGNGSDPVVLFVKVTKAQRPVVGAKVVVVMQVGSSAYDLPLYDNGGGNPDVTGDDGVYSRYWVFAPEGVKIYTLVVKVSPTSSSKVVGYNNSQVETGLKCCGNVLVLNHLPAEDFVDTFTQVVGTAVVASEAGKEDVFPPARVTDLRGQPSSDKVTLTFTAPGDDLDRGYALEYRVFWSDPSQQVQEWKRLEDLTYVVVEGGTLAQVQLVPPECDQEFYYSVKAYDTILQDGGNSNVASISVACGIVTTPLPTPPSPSGCPSTAGAICGAFFGGLAAGLLIAALGYFVYQKYYKPLRGSENASSHTHEMQHRRQNNRPHAGYKNNAFTSDNPATQSERYTASPLDLIRRRVNPKPSSSPNQERSLPQPPTQERSLPQPPTQERSLPQPPTQERSLPQPPIQQLLPLPPPIQEQSLPQPPTQERSLPQPPNQGRSLPQPPNQERSLPQPPTQERSLPQPPTQEQSQRPLPPPLTARSIPPAPSNSDQWLHQIVPLPARINVAATNNSQMPRRSHQFPGQQCRGPSVDNGSLYESMGDNVSQTSDEVYDTAYS